MTEEKRALCVGINNFKFLPQKKLDGCVNDSKEMSMLLKDIYRFEDRNITILNDAEATKENIMKNLKSMVDGAIAGNYKHLVFTLSSHGTQTADKGEEEPDHADEAFVPYDLCIDSTGLEYDRDFLIIDDELREIFRPLPKDVLLEVYLDTCCSGDGIKAFDLILDRKPRYLPAPSRKAHDRLAGVQVHGLREGLLEDGVHNHILWSACRSDQESKDAFIAGDWHGAFTYYFIKELRAATNPVTRKELLNKVRRAVEPTYHQNPQLQCNITHKSKRVG